MSRRPRAAALLCGLVGWLIVSCAGQATGPPFRAASAPPEHRARVYLYRIDPRSSLAIVDLELDGLEIGRFRDREYETLEIAAGPHQLKARMRGLGFSALGWNAHRLRARPGETIYVEIAVRLTAQPPPPSRALEIAGRSSTAASENVFLIERGEDEALEWLQTTTRVAP